VITAIVRMSISWSSAFLVVACLAVCLNAAPLAEEQPLADEGGIQWRLTGETKPSWYNITLKPLSLVNNTESLFLFEGHAHIHFKTNETRNEIKLHSRNLNFTEMCVYVPNTPNQCNKVQRTEHDLKTDIMTIQYLSGFTKDVEYVLYFEYMGSMDDDMHGFYRSSYVDSKNVTKWLGSTQFQTNHARRAFPCFDEPKYKANFTLNLIRHKSMKTFSNHRIISSERLGTDWYIDRYATTPKMSTYLVAFIFSEFNERFNGDFGVIARPEYYSQTDYAHEVGQRVLNELDSYLGIKYYEKGIDKMHMAAIPDFSAGAMENWGLLTYRERALLYDPSTTTLNSKQYIATVVAHEQAHMWFGDLVTCDWWSYTWLNEGFARFFQYYATANVEKDYHLDMQFTVDQVQSVMGMDATNNTNPMSDENTNTPADLSRMFNSISYNKGASFIRMTKHILGDDNFQKSLHEYLKENEYKNTIPSQLFQHWLQYWPTVHKDHANEYFRSFTEQVGYPVVTVNVTAFGSNSGFVVSQQRFLLKENDGSDHSLTYRVPFTYTTSEETNFNDTQVKAFLTEKDFNHSHGKNFTWAIANVQQAGYYRVNYDIQNWHKIHGALMKDNFSGIHVLNRAQIVDDLLNLARAGIVKYDDAFDILDFLKLESHYSTWTSAFNGFSYISIRLGSDTNDFSNYILKMTEKAYNMLGFEQKSDDTSLDIYLRTKVLSWACRYGHPDCIDKANSYFNNHLMNVPVNIRAPVYCSAMRQGAEKDFNHLWQHYGHVNSATEQVLILNALGCVKEQKLIEKYFNMILSNDIRRQDKSSALTSLYTENNENVSPVFELVTNHADELAEAMGGYSAVANVISGIASRFTEEKQKKDLENFVNDSKNKDKFQSSFSTLEKAVTTVGENMEWSKKNLPSIKSILLAKGSNGSVKITMFNVITLLFIASISMLL
jgi:aminopeptidase N